MFLNIFEFQILLNFAVYVVSLRLAGREAGSRSGAVSMVRLLAVLAVIRYHLDATELYKSPGLPEAARRISHGSGKCATPIAKGMSVS